MSGTSKFHPCNFYKFYLFFILFFYDSFKNFDDLKKGRDIMNDFEKHFEKLIRVKIIIMGRNNKED